MTGEVARAIESAVGISLGDFTQRPVGGGCINDARLITAKSGERWFVKLNTADRLEMFEAESAGLTELRTAAAIRVPNPIASGVAGSTAFLVLEALELGSRGDGAAMGRQLADLHRHTSDSSKFGWRRDNFIGGHEPSPSLLHGDLWGGNAGFDSAGEPVIFDPAVYFGDREAELAFTRMFGGFSADFRRIFTTSTRNPGHFQTAGRSANRFTTSTTCSITLTSSAAATPAKPSRSSAGSPERRRRSTPGRFLPFCRCASGARRASSGL